MVFVRAPVSLTNCSNATNATVTFGTTSQAVPLFKATSTINATTAGSKLELQDRNSGQWYTVPPGNTSMLTPGGDYSLFKTE